MDLRLGESENIKRKGYELASFHSSNHLSSSCTTHLLAGSPLATSAYGHTLFTTSYLFVPVNTFVTLEKNRFTLSGECTTTRECVMGKLMVT
jgi:hypothetical protein